MFGISQSSASTLPLDRDGPSKDFEKNFLKNFDPNGYKRKYGKEDKQTLLPPSYMRKRGGNNVEKAGKYKGLDRKKNMTLSQLEGSDSQKGTPKGKETPIN